MKFVVLDVSVATKWYVRETDSETAQRLLDSGLQFAVPDIFFSEVANALLKHHANGDIGLGDVLLGIEDLFAMEIEPVAAQLLMARAVEIAAPLKHAVYDCLYLALAERWDTTFVTADRKFHDRLADLDWQNRITMLVNADQIV
jgi:predicted nucleic acid-binding protein